MEVAIMIEGQNGLNWPRWQRIAQAVEDLGFVGLYRSDHISGTPTGIVEQLGRLSEVGVQRVMLQWLDQDDLDGLEALARTVLPQL
jgi:alkanesulfonate monooxygenase SsuD/methylene tetrahydromethanopterin reductase-like flavin-dependent oxidoreductase (luciferase family)